MPKAKAKQSRNEAWPNSSKSKAVSVENRLLGPDPRPSSVDSLTMNIETIVSPSDTRSLDACRLRYGPHESWRLLNNLVVLGLAFVVLFSAFAGTANLQSSLNQEHGLGTYSLATVYVTLILASLVLPPFVIHKLHAKVTMVLAISGYTLYVAAQFYPRFHTLIPAAVCLGAGAANLWAASSAYITTIAREYAHLKRLPLSAVLQRFFGLFFLFLFTSQIWGNLISTSVLTKISESDSDNSTTKRNNSLTCGAAFCPSEAASDSSSSSAFEHPEMHKIYTLFGIYTGCTVAAAVIILLFLDSSVRYGELDHSIKNKATSTPKATELLAATLKHWRKPAQILVIPLSLWTGMQEAFIGADFTIAFISCAWGVEHIGLVMMCFGVCASVFSAIVGRVTEAVGRPVVFCTAALLNLGCLLTMLNWDPEADADSRAVYFVLAGLWGAADGVWQAQCRALYGTLFPDTTEAAFSNMGIWLSLGFIIAYLNAGAGRACMSTKIWVCIGVLCVAMVGYIVIEVTEKRRRARMRRE